MLRRPSIYCCYQLYRSRVELCPRYVLSRCRAQAKGEDTAKNRRGEVATTGSSTHPGTRLKPWAGRRWSGKCQLESEGGAVPAELPPAAPRGLPMSTWQFHTRKVPKLVMAKIMLRYLLPDNSQLRKVCGKNDSKWLFRKLLLFIFFSSQ